MNRPSSGSARRSSSVDSSAARPGRAGRRTLARYAETARVARRDQRHVPGHRADPSRRRCRPDRPDAAEAAGAPLHVLSHEEEAFLTLIGVTEGMPVTHETLVVDVGGGSSEFCIVDAVQRPRAAGLRLGSARLTDRFVDARSTDAARGRRDARRRSRRPPRRPGRSPTEIVAVGGTASNLLKVLPAAIADRILTRERIAAIQAILATRPAAATAVAVHASTRSGRGSCRPVARSSTPSWTATARAPIRVSEAGLREGAILAVDHAGRAWRDRLPDLAHGWRT